MPGRLYGYQLAHGVIPRLGWGNDDPTVCHTCDNHSCQRPEHLRLGTPAENRAEWLARRKDPGSPLADLRGPAERSRAIAAAIRAGQEHGEGEPEVVARIRAAIAAGRPHISHSGMPSLYNAEVTSYRGRWTMSVIGPDREIVAGPNIDLGPADVLTVAHPDDPGRYLIAIDGEVSVLPREQAVQHLEKHGFVVAASAVTA